jgi:AcrR family transcriptional regulator
MAGISRVLLYRHFDSKTDLYRAVLDRAIARLTAAVGTPDFTFASIEALLGATTEDPDRFRLLFRHAAREPEFRREMDGSAGRWTVPPGAWWPPPAAKP